MALSTCSVQIDPQGKELLSHGTAFFPAACYHDTLSLESVPWHWHDELEVILITEGTAVIAAGSEKRTVHQGDGFFINAGVLHAVWQVSDEPCRLHSIVFHPRLVGGSTDSIFWHKYVQPLLNDHSCKELFLDHRTAWQQMALDDLEQAWQNCTREDFGYEFQVRSSLSHLICLLTKHLASEPEHFSEKVIRDGERMKQMLQYIQEHIAEELRTPLIAEHASISVSECLRCFHSTIGMTPIQYVKQFRIQKAAELLTSTDLKIVDVGSQCGFQEMSYFSKLFREQFGCTPTEYRKEHD